MEIKNKILAPYLNDSISFVLAGDMNTNKGSSAYNNMLDIFELQCSPLKDKRPYSYESMNSWNTETGITSEYWSSIILPLSAFFN